MSVRMVRGLGLRKRRFKLVAARLAAARATTGRGQVAHANSFEGGLTCE
jgi:hypothetical protein